MCGCNLKSAKDMRLSQQPLISQISRKSREMY